MVRRFEVVLGTCRYAAVHGTWPFTITSRVLCLDHKRSCVYMISLISLQEFCTGLCRHRSGRAG
jgi:hypothetical protein